MANGSRGNRDDNFEDDRPFRHRPRDKFDDDSGFSSRPMPQAKGVNVMGVIALTLGIVGLVISLIPCFGIIGIPLTAIGLLLGMIGIFTSGGTTGRGLPIAGTSVSLIGLLIGIAWIALAGVWVKQANDQIKQDQVESEKQAQVAREKELESEIEMREGKAILVTATELDKDYNANLIGAEWKYKDQVVELTGKVKQVGREVRGYWPWEQKPGRRWIEVEAEGARIVKCLFREDADTVAAVVKVEINKNVTIRGRCKGKSKGREAFEIGIENCVIVRPSSKAK